MGRLDEELRARLLTEHDEYKRLAEQHRGCDQRLTELSRKAFLSGEEQLEERTLKKQKLRLKDMMEVIKVRYVAEHA